MQVDTTYSPAVTALLSHDSSPFELASEEIPDYVQELGFTPADIPELALLSRDNQFDNFDGLEFSAPLRAAYALAQLVPEAPQEALESLISLYDLADPWYEEVVAEIIAPIGPVAIDSLVAYLNNQTKPEMARMEVQHCLYLIAKEFPETKDRFREELVACLEKYEQNPPVLNGCLINDLIKLKATETAALMESAYRAERVDMMMSGPWASVQVALGLKAASDFTEEELQVPLDAIPEPLQKLRLAIEGLTSIKPKRPSPKGFGVGTSTKKSKKKSKKK